MDLDVVIAKAKDGDADCQLALGMAYAFGDNGLQQNDALAVNWLAEAAKGGSCDAMFALCDTFLFGLGVSMDLLAAAEWYSCATERANVEDPSLIRSSDVNTPYVATSAALLEIIGATAITRLEADRCLWRYFGTHRCLDSANPRVVHAANLEVRCLLGGRQAIRIFELRGWLDYLMEEVPAGSDGKEIIREALKPRPFQPFTYGELQTKPDTPTRLLPKIRHPDPSVGTDE